jgi:YHS domain-containing protein
MITDLVCNMQLNEQEVMHTRTFEGEVYYFCSEACRAEFERHTEDYVKQAQPGQEREADVQISLLHG